MKRKIIKLGQATYVMSLPSKWIRKYGLQQGDYLEVDEVEGHLSVGVEKKETRKSVSLDLQKMDTRLASAFIETAYALGHDPIELVHGNQLKNYLGADSVETNQFLQDFVNEKCIGSEIIEQTSKRTVLKDLGGGVDEESIDNVFQRVLFIMKMMSQDVLSALQAGDRQHLQSQHLKTKNISKLLLYYARVLNTSKLSTNTIRIRNSMLAYLRFMNSTYKVLIRETLRTKKFYSKNSVALFSNVTTHIHDMISLLLKFNEERAIEFIDKREQTWKNIYTFKPVKEDYLLYSHLGALMGSTWFVAKHQIALHNN